MPRTGVDQDDDTSSQNSTESVSSTSSSEEEPTENDQHQHAYAGIAEKALRNYQRLCTDGSLPYHSAGQLHGAENSSGPATSSNEEARSSESPPSRPSKRKNPRKRKTRDDDCDLNSQASLPNKIDNQSIIQTALSRYRTRVGDIPVEETSSSAEAESSRSAVAAKTANRTQKQEENPPGFATADTETRELSLLHQPLNGAPQEALTMQGTSPQVLLQSNPLDVASLPPNPFLPNPNLSPPNTGIASPAEERQLLKDSTQTKAKSKKVKRAPRNKRPSGKPQRPLSAYNIFFRDKRKTMMAEQKGGQGSKGKDNKIGFANLGKMIGKLWQEISPEELNYYEDQAKQEKERYTREMKAYDDDLPARILREARLTVEMEDRQQKGADSDQKPQKSDPQANAADGGGSASFASTVDQQPAVASVAAPIEGTQQQFYRSAGGATMPTIPSTSAGPQLSVPQESANPLHQALRQAQREALPTDQQTNIPDTQGSTNPLQQFLRFTRQEAPDNAETNQQIMELLSHLFQARPSESNPEPEERRGDHG